jgi:hypothetical protein
MAPLTREGLCSRQRRARRTEEQRAADRIRANEAARRRRAARTNGQAVPPVRPPAGEALSLTAIAALKPRPIRTPWRANPCPHCGARLLSSEPSIWCCRNGVKVLDRLPPLPIRFQDIITSSPAVISKHSRELNYLFALSAIGVSNGVKTGWSEYKGTVIASVQPFALISLLLLLFVQRRRPLLARYGGSYLSSSFLDGHDQI